MKKAAKFSLELREVNIRVQGHNLVRDLSLMIGSGETLTVMGKSGSGKSSLLGFICGTLSREFEVSGKVFLDNEEITHLPPERRRIGILFQDDLLFPHLSVAQNLAFGLATEQGSRRQRREKIEQTLAHIGMTGFGDRDPATLSGGQRARIAMMRTLLAMPKAVLLDEPFNKLDASLRSRFRQFVFSHIRKANLPCLLVTHDEADAVAANGEIIVLRKNASSPRVVRRKS